ncbi:hypothetical protein BOTBODRAFT_199842 [Botryobasidium botryosum FD-172 SS1]|uniref:Transmembrane protein n=1 Tax=Botryobasidium botryosum (strain FD-172 SS1) TaxID=930990 RepID=A0A067NB82_BOTB1|nr:hypothetical protein BOTBODRAFT_199842 [Botryobasidium botryosum FD-172 SS1]
MQKVTTYLSASLRFSFVFLIAVLQFLIFVAVPILLGLEHPTNQDLPGTRPDADMPPALPEQHHTSNMDSDATAPNMRDNANIPGAPSELMEIDEPVDRNGPAQIALDSPPSFYTIPTTTLPPRPVISNAQSSYPDHLPQRPVSIEEINSSVPHAQSDEAKLQVIEKIDATKARLIEILENTSTNASSSTQILTAAQNSGSVKENRKGRKKSHGPRNGEPGPLSRLDLSLPAKPSGPRGVPIHTGRSPQSSTLRSPSSRPPRNVAFNPVCLSNLVFRRKHLLTP